MSVDSSQSLGTLVGYANKLILRNVDEGNRLVLLAEGPVAYAKTSSHLSVTVATDSIVKVHAFREDRALGGLIDNGSLQSKLVVAYLHALTSFCALDDLTQRTGTEQALTILGLAAVSSFTELSKPNVDILTAIARLTPGPQPAFQACGCMPATAWLHMFDRVWATAA